MTASHSKALPLHPVQLPSVCVSPTNPRSLNGAGFGPRLLFDICVLTRPAVMVDECASEAIADSQANYGARGAGGAASALVGYLPKLDISTTSLF